MRKNTKCNKLTPAERNLPAAAKTIPAAKMNWSVIWSNFTDAITKHPVASGVLGFGALATVGGGIYLSHDVMEHDYDAEFNLLYLVHIKLNKRR